MQTVDVLIIVMAAVAIVGSATGVALYEPPTGGVEFAVTFDESDQKELDSIDAGSQTGNGGSDLNADFELTAANISSLTFRADISASSAGGLGGTSAVDYTVVVLNETGAEVNREEGSISATGTSTTVDVTVPQGQLCPVPEETTLESGTLEEARADAEDRFGCDKAATNWTVEITVSGDTDGPLARTHSATIAALGTTYSATVSSDVPTPRTA